MNPADDASRLSELAKCSYPSMCTALQAGVRYAVKNPYSYVHANIGGHVSLLEAIRAAVPMPALVYASSSSVYGLNTKLPFSEKDRVDQPASLYASTKRVSCNASIIQSFEALYVQGLACMFNLSMMLKSCTATDFNYNPSKFKDGLLR